MTVIRYAIVFAAFCMTQAQYANYQPVQVQDQPSRTLQVPEYIQQSQQEPIIAYTLQLPRLEAPNEPFYNPEVISDLRPPTNNYGNIPVVFYEYPAPSQDLQVPLEEPWNPSNDPKLYFNNVNYETPTNTHPKKFNKEVHEKAKQVHTETRKEIPEKTVVSNEELAQQQKTSDKFAKLENQKQIKVPIVRNKEEEPQTQASEPHLTHVDDNVAEDISSSITHSLGVKALPGERFQFHMHGHKGPNSYKFGFDTGKGQNRQFRFEERDQDGHVKGQYGYYDKTGKLHMYHYNADPESGFSAKSDTDDKNN